MRNIIDHVRLSADETRLIILDQRRLPLHREYLVLATKEQMYDAVKTLAVRGAPAIGIFAGFAMFVLAQGMPETRPEFDAEFTAAADYLNSSRPTAVNLSWALKRMRRVVESDPARPVAALLPALRDEAQAILDEDIAMCRAISEHGLSLLHDGDGILTHCNAGPIATSRYGTAIGPMILGAQQGRKFRVFADETRPLLQGARLTAYELSEAGMDVTLLCDGMAASAMRNGWVDAVFTGADRVAANGDAANKIGTFPLAIAAKRLGVPFYICAPSSTIDMNTPTGKDIKIEQRPAEEVTTMWYAERMAPEGVKVFNPAFDVTDADLITAIITEKGVHYPPFAESLSVLR